MIAEILSIGDELTNGTIVDTNAAWLAMRLERLGLRVLHHVTVGDELAILTDAFRTAINRADIVVATGGLGPTADDLTRESLADAAEVGLEFFPEAYEHCRALFERRGRPMPAQNRVQAISPVGTRLIPNPDGTALGVDLTVTRGAGRSACRVFCVAGVPAEMRASWETIELRLRDAGIVTETIVQREIHCFGAGESLIESMLPDLVRRGRDPRVGITASDGTITLRISTTADSVAVGDARIAPVAALIHESLGDLVYGEGETTLPDAVLQRLAASGEATLAVSLVGGSTRTLDALRDAARQFRPENTANKMEHPSEFLWVSGVVLSDAVMARRLYEMAVETNDDADDNETIGDDATGSGGHSPAERVRRLFGAAWGLSVTDSVKTNTEHVETDGTAGNGWVRIDISGPHGETDSMTFIPMLHPAIRDAFIARTAWNRFRLTLPTTVDVLPQPKI